MQLVLDRLTVDRKLENSIEYLFCEASIDFNFLHIFSDEFHEIIEQQVTSWSDNNYAYRIFYKDGDYKLLRKLIVE